MKTFLIYHKESLRAGEVFSYVKIQSLLWPHPPTRGDQLPLKKYLTPKKERNQNKNEEFFDAFCSSTDPIEEVYQGVLSS